MHPSFPCYFPRTSSQDEWDSTAPQIEGAGVESVDRQMGVKTSWATTELGTLDSSSNPHLLNMPYPQQLVSASKALVQSSGQSPGHGPSLLTGLQDPLLPSIIHFPPTSQTIFLKLKIPLLKNFQ